MKRSTRRFRTCGTRRGSQSHRSSPSPPSLFSFCGRQHVPLSRRATPRSDFPFHGPSPPISLRPLQNENIAASSFNIAEYIPLAYSDLAPLTEASAFGKALTDAVTRSSGSDSVSVSLKSLDSSVPRSHRTPGRLRRLVVVPLSTSPRFRRW